VKHTCRGMLRCPKVPMPAVCEPGLFDGIAVSPASVDPKREVGFRRVRSFETIVGPVCRRQYKEVRQYINSQTHL